MEIIPPCKFYETTLTNTKSFSPLTQKNGAIPKRVCNEPYIHQFYLTMQYDTIIIIRLQPFCNIIQLAHKQSIK